MSNKQLRSKFQSGFTLIEVLVIAPIVVLLIGAFVAFVVTLTGDSLQVREKNGAAYDVQSALNDMEANTIHATEFVTNTGTLPSPQGKNDSTAAFTNTTSGQPDTLITRAATTTKNPYDETRALIYTGTGACNASNPIHQYKTIYFVQDETLFKRTIVDAGAACAVPWQRNSCNQSGVSSNPSLCKAEDEKLVENVTALDVEYYADSSSTTALADSAAASANTVSIQITVGRQVAGSTVSYGGVVRATSLNTNKLNNDQEQAAAPTITWSQNPTTPYTTKFQWEAAGNASGYNIEYKIGSGTWQQGPQNTSALTYSIEGAYRQQTMQLRVTAITPGPNLDYGTATAYIPDWNDCSLKNGWVDYGSVYPPTAGFTRTSNGVVALQGLVRGGTATPYTVLCTLPEGFRPSNRLIFAPATNGTTQARIDIETNGDVIFVSGSNSWVSFNGINFLASGANWTDLTGLNSWTNYGGVYAPIQVSKDASGRVFLQGLAKGGSTTAYIEAFSMPASFQKSVPDIYPAASNSVGTMYIKESSSSIAYRGSGGNQYWSLQAMYYSGSSGSWVTPSLSNGWVPNGSYYNTAQYVKNTDGIVTLAGLIKNGTVTSGTTIFTLPAGYRPANNIICSVITSSNVFARIDVLPNGQVMTREGVNAGWLSLAGCDFIAEQ